MILSLASFAQPAFHFQPIICSGPAGNGGNIEGSEASGSPVIGTIRGGQVEGTSPGVGSRLVDTFPSTSVRIGTVSAEGSSVPSGGGIKTPGTSSTGVRVSTIGTVSAESSGIPSGGALPGTSVRISAIGTTPGGTLPSGISGGGIKAPSSSSAIRIGTVSTPGSTIPSGGAIETGGIRISAISTTPSGSVPGTSIRISAVSSGTVVRSTSVGTVSASIRDSTEAVRVGNENVFDLGLLGSSVLVLVVLTVMVAVAVAMLVVVRVVSVMVLVVVMLGLEGLEINLVGLEVHKRRHSVEVDKAHRSGSGVVGLHYKIIIIN